MYFEKFKAFQVHLKHWLYYILKCFSVDPIFIKLISNLSKSSKNVLEVHCYINTPNAFNIILIYHFKKMC